MDKRKFEMDGYTYIVEVGKMMTGDYRVIVTREKRTLGIQHSMDSKQDAVPLNEVEDTIEQMLLEFKGEKEEKEDGEVEKKIDSAISSVVD